MDGPWSKFAPPADAGPWSKFAPSPAAPSAAAPVPPTDWRAPYSNPQPPAQPAWTPPLGYRPTGEVMSASEHGPPTMGAGPLVRAMQDENRPIGQRALATAGHVAGTILRAGPDAIQSLVQSMRTGQELSPEAIGTGAMSMLPGALETGGLRAPKPPGAPPRIEPPPLDATRARVAGAEAVGKVADRVSAKPWERFADEGAAPWEKFTVDPRARAAGETAVGKVADRIASPAIRTAEGIARGPNHDAIKAQGANLSALPKGFVQPIGAHFAPEVIGKIDGDHIQGFYSTSGKVRLLDGSEVDVLNGGGAIWGPKGSLIDPSAVSHFKNNNSTDWHPVQKSSPKGEEGFVTESGKFLTRDEAAKHATETGQNASGKTENLHTHDLKDTPATEDPVPEAVRMMPKEKQEAFWAADEATKQHLRAVANAGDRAWRAERAARQKLFEENNPANFAAWKAARKKAEKLDKVLGDGVEQTMVRGAKLAAERRAANRAKVEAKRPPAPPPAKLTPVTFGEWEAAFSTPDAKKATDIQTKALKRIGAENYYGVPTKGSPEAYEGKDYWKKTFAEPAKPAVPPPVPSKAAAPPVMPAAPAVPKPKKAAAPKIKPTIPPGTEPHVAKLIEKGNNFFADQAKVQPATTLPMDLKSRIKRAKDLGFNTTLNLYHGTSDKNFIAFDISLNKTEPAIFVHDNPKLSQYYGGKKILPLWGKFENPMTIEKFGNYSNSKVMDAINKAKAGGYTEIILKGMHDIEGKNITQYLFLKPENLRARDAAVFDPAKKSSPNLLSAAPAVGPHASTVKALPDPEVRGTVKDLSDKLHRTERRHDKAKLEALEKVRELPPEAAKLAEKFFNFLEPGGKKPTLTAEEKVIFDKHLKPSLENIHDYTEEIKKYAPDKLPPGFDPNYISHLVQGKTPEFDEQLGIVSHEPNSPWFGSKTLPRSTRSLKNSKYYVLDDGTTRQVIKLDEKGNAYRMMGKTPHNIPAKDIAGDVKPGETVAIAGKKYNIVRASVAEKEGATNLKYYKNAYLAAYSTEVALKKVAEAHKFFEQMKDKFQNDPQVKPLARWPGDKRPIPKDFRTTTLPGWEGWKFEPRLVEAMDDWHNKPGEPFEEALKNITHGIVGTLFLFPFRHIANVAGHYYVGRMGDALAHPKLPGIPLRHFATAMWDTLRQGDLTKDMLHAGSALQLPKVLNADFNGQLLKGLEKQWKQNPRQWSWLFKKLGVNPVDIYNGWLKASSAAMWYASDVMMQALVREKMERGLSLEDAIAGAEKDIPNYRINSRVMMQGNSETKFGRARGMVGRGISRYLQNSLFSVFGRYNNNKWRAVADMVNDIVKGGEPGTRKEGVAKALALASLIYFVYYPLDSAVKQMTGRKDKRSSPFGPVDIADKAKQLGELAMPQTMRRMGATDDEVHAVQLLQSFIGLSPMLDETATQVFGRNPYTGQEVTTPGERAESLLQNINPAAIAAETASGKTSLLEQVLKSTIGIRSVPRAAPIAIQKREQRAQDKREMMQPYSHAIGSAQRALQPFTPDAIVNRFLPSTSQ